MVAGGAGYAYPQTTHIHKVQHSQLATHKQSTSNAGV